jgi:L-alanine-DL-glutamate epimerase-like enolase superfamily enzyme
MIGTTIREIEIADLDIPLLVPFGIASGAQELAANLLVTVELADGTRGYGEAAPFAAVNGETQASARAALAAARSLVMGADVREWRPLAGALASAIPEAPSARCAAECALLDALTRRAGMPLWAFFGGAGTRLETDMTVTTGSAAQAAEDARKILGRGIQTIKVKVGGASQAEDLERVLAIRAAAPDSPLILDGNCGFDVVGALELVAELRARGVRLALLEQPLPREDWAGMARLTREAGVPVAADESLRSPADALRLAQESAASVFNIKLMKMGVVGALDVVGVARAAGLGLMIGGMVESILAMTCSACFAAGIGGFDYVDLDTPMFLAENPFQGGFTQQGAELSLAAISAGHGVEPR